MKIKFYLSVSTLLIILLVCNGNIFMVNNNLSDNLLLANIDSLAFIEGGGGSEVKCSTTDITEVTSIRQGNTLVKVSECRTCSCNFGSGGSCEEGQECVITVAHLQVNQVDLSRLYIATNNFVLGGVLVISILDFL